MRSPVCLLFPMVLASCISRSGSSDAGAVSATIGAAGGTLYAADGTGVSIPAGALSNDTVITITPAPGAPTPAGTTVVGTAYDFGPEGLQFAQPVTVTLAFVPGELPGGSTAANVSAFTAAVGSSSYASLGGTPVDATHVKATSSHFSIFVPAVPTTSGDGGTAADGGGGDGGSCGTVCNGSCVNTSTDPNNCGGCGIVCGGTCTSGRCLVTLYTPTGTVAATNPEFLAIDSNNVYFTDNYDPNSAYLEQVPKAGGTDTTLFGDTDPSYPGNYIKGFAVSATNIYFINNCGTPGCTQNTCTGPVGGTPGIIAMPIGSGCTFVAAANPYATWNGAIAVDTANLYWSDVEPNYTAVIRTTPLPGVPDGGPGTVLASDPQATNEVLVVDATNVYWGLDWIGAGNTPARIMSTPKAGGSSTALWTAPNNPAVYVTSLAVDQTNVYWVSTDTTSTWSVMSVPTTGGTATTLATTTKPVEMWTIAVDATSVYALGTHLTKIPIGGGTPVTLVLGNTNGTHGIAVDATSVYFASGAIYKLTPK